MSRFVNTYRGGGEPLQRTGAAPGNAVSTHFVASEPWGLLYIQNLTGGSMLVKLAGDALDPAGLTNFTFKIVSGGEKLLTIRDRKLSVYFYDDGGTGTTYTQGASPGFVLYAWGEISGQSA